MRRPHDRVRGDEQRHRCAEQGIIARILGEPPGPVLARHADRGIELLADAETARAPRLGQVFGIDRIGPALAARMLFQLLRHIGEEPPQRLAGAGMHPPGLEIATRRRTRRDREHLAHHLARHRPVEEGPAGEPGEDGGGDGARVGAGHKVLFGPLHPLSPDLFPGGTVAIA